MMNVVPWKVPRPKTLRALLCPRDIIQHSIPSAFPKKVLISDKVTGVCRTDPATSGLLTICYTLVNKDDPTCVWSCWSCTPVQSFMGPSRMARVQNF